MKRWVLRYRRKGTTTWSEISYVTETSTLEAKAMAHGMVQCGNGGLEAMRSYEFKWYRNGVCVATWEDDGR